MKIETTFQKIMNDKSIDFEIKKYKDRTDFQVTIEGPNGSCSKGFTETLSEAKDFLELCYENEKSILFGGK